MNKKHYALALKARAKMKKMLDSGERRWDKRASVGLVRLKEKEFYFHSNQECHAGLGSWDAPVGTVAVVNGLQKGKIDIGDGTRSIIEGEPSDLTYEEQRYYLDWLLNRSPYASTFQSKSASHALKQGFTISRTDVPANLMAGGMVASRRLWEFTWIAKVMVALSKLGVNENLAFFIGSCSNMVKEEVYFNYANTGHCSLNVYGMTFKGLKNWIENKPVKLLNNYCLGTGYGDYSNMFEVTRRQGDAFEFVGEFTMKVEVKKENINPFGKARAEIGTKTYPFDEAMAAMAEYAKTIMEKVNNA